MRARNLSIVLAVLASILASNCPAQFGFTGVYDSWNDVTLGGLVSLNGNATYAVTDSQVFVSLDANNVPDGITVTVDIHGAVTVDLKALPQVSGSFDTVLPLATILLPPIQFGPNVLVFPVAGAYAHISGTVSTDARIGLMQNFEIPVSASLTTSGLNAGLLGTPKVAQSVAPPNEAALDVTVEIVAGITFQVVYTTGGFAITLGGPAFMATFTVHALVDPLADPWWAADASFGFHVSYMPIPGYELFPTSLYSQRFYVDDAGGPLIPNSLPPSRWSRVLDLGGDEDVTAVVPLPDGLFVIGNTGLTNRPYLAKLNWDGTPVFENQGQLTANSSFRPLDATTASNDDILVCGHTLTSGGARVERFTTAGAPIWSKILNAPSGTLISVNDIAATDDGGAVVAGSITNVASGVTRPLAAKLDQAGSPVAAGEFDLGGAVTSAVFSTVVSTSDGGFLFAGRVNYQDAPVWAATLYSYNLLAVKVDANGAVQFTTTIGTVYWDEIQAACQGDDGTYVLGGIIGHNTHAAWLVGLDAAGNEIWSRSLAGQSISGSAGNTAYDTINSIVAVEGGYVVSGFTGLGNATRDAWIIGVDWDGVTTFFKSFRAAHNDELAGIALLSDGYIAYGATHSLGAGASPLRDLWLVRTAVDGYLDFTPQSGFDAFNDHADWSNTSHAQLSLPCTLLGVSLTTTSGGQSYSPVTATVTVLTP